MMGGFSIAKKTGLSVNGFFRLIAAFGHILKLGWIKANAAVEIIGADIDQLIGLFFEEVVRAGMIS